ncbi:MAG: PD40 domain-containing protein [Actinobacteria bacterium]|nr:PD40 domain-containing protein [Actinomycetota bacterium]
MTSKRHRPRVGLTAALSTALTVGLMVALPTASSAASDNHLMWAQFNNQNGSYDIYVHQPEDEFGGVLARPNSQMEPSFLPDGSGAVFASREGLDFDLVVATAGQIQTVTDRDTDQRDPEFSPDGQHIAFTERDDLGGEQIGVVNADGNGYTQLTDQGRNRKPSYSPDARRITFVSDRNTGWAIMEMNADGSDQRVLHQSESRLDNPSYSPDGQYILYSSPEGGDRDLYRLHRSGRIDQLTHTPDWQERHAEYSPDGSRIVYSADQIGVHTHIYTGNADGTGRELVSAADQESVHPAWQPDPDAMVDPADPPPPLPPFGPEPPAADQPPEQQPQPPAAPQPDPAGADPAPAPAPPVGNPPPPAQNPAPQPSAPVPGTPDSTVAQDTAGPVIKLRGRPRAGGTHAAARVKVLRGRANDPSGIRSVKLGLSKRGRHCQHLRKTGRLRKSRNCSPKLLSTAVRDGRFSLRLKQPLPGGRYRITVRAKDRAGNAATLRKRFRIR